MCEESKEEFIGEMLTSYVDYHRTVTRTQFQLHR